MGYSYRLGDEDRERLGCPEWLSVALTECRLDDITELSDRFDFELEDWPEVLRGEVPFEAAGSPDADSMRKPPKWGIQAMLWLALHQADVDATWEQVGRLKVLQVQRREDEEPGKEEATQVAEPDPTSEPSTTQPSSTSSPD